jgi:hypothetical protein
MWSAAVLLGLYRIKASLTAYYQRSTFLRTGRRAQVSVLYLFDSWSIEIDGRINEKRYSRVRTRCDGFRRLGGDRVSPQLP